MPTSYATPRKKLEKSYRNLYSMLLAIFSYAILCYQYAQLNPAMLIVTDSVSYLKPISIMFGVITFVALTVAYILTRTSLNGRDINENVVLTVLPFVIASVITFMVGPYTGPSGIDGIASAIVHQGALVYLGPILIYLFNIIATIRQNKHAITDDFTKTKTITILVSLGIALMVFAIRQIHNAQIPAPQEPDPAYEYTSRGYSESERYLEELYAYYDKLW